MTALKPETVRRISFSGIALERQSPCSAQPPFSPDRNNKLF
jgi:hypothetical protein